MECIQETGPDQTEYIGGICTEDGVKGAIPIPGLDSFLVGFSTDTVVTGLDEIPANERPPANTLLHLSFDAMVGIGTALMGLGPVVRLRLVATARIPRTPWFLRAVAVSGVAAIVALWCGWIVTEVGRQPWIVQGYMRTEEAVTEAEGLWFAFAGVVVLYAGLGTTAIVILRTLSRRWREADEGVAEGEVPIRPPRRAAREGPVTRADLCAAILWTGATLYAVFGGADFGAGLWDLIAGGAERGKRPRALIERSLTPVWEANHVWLIFILVVLWTAFPEAFGAVMSTLYVPLALAAVGIVLRGAGFAFRESVRSLEARRAMGAAFAVSSVLTPFFMGTVVGAIADGNVPPGVTATPSPAGCSRCRSSRARCSSPRVPTWRQSSSSSTRAARASRTWSATSPAALSAPPWLPAPSPSPASLFSTPTAVTSTTASSTKRCRW